MKKVLLGMSGGLDSTYSVLALRDAGFDVGGVTLVMHGYTDTSDARECAGSLGVPFYEVDCREKFDSAVKADFVREYSRGRTPNPCVVCNRYVKFACLCDAADTFGYELVATGHYAGKGEANGRVFIKKGVDPKKDQSYMLWALTQEQIRRVVFPLGMLCKSSVRESAREAGLPSADAAESEDICFLPDTAPTDFVENAVGKFPEGDFVDKDGNVLGRHKGIARYTVGQRRGLGVSSSSRLFVTDIVTESNTVVLGREDELFSFGITVSSLNFQKDVLHDGESGRYSVKIRYAAPPVPALVTVRGDTALVTFDSPVKAAAPGQSAVFYDGDSIAFGGIIDGRRQNGKF